MRFFSSLPGPLAVAFSLAAMAMACVGSDPEPAPDDRASSSSSSSGDAGALASGSSSSSSSSGAASSSGFASSSSGAASSSGAPNDAGPATYSKGGARLHWSLLDANGGPLRCDSAGGQTMQGEATPLGAGGNNLQNGPCEAAATNGTVLVGGLPLDGVFTVSVSLYEHQDPVDDPAPISFAPVQDLSFPDGGGCDEIANDTCIVDFAMNVVVPHP